MYYEILKKLGFTFTSSVPTGPAYIMNDGMFLDIKSSMKIIDPSNTLQPTHPAVDEYLIEEGYIDSNAEVSRVLCDADNAIRVNDGTNFLQEVVVGLPKQEPTTAQYNSLEEWLWSMTSKGSVAVGDERSTNIFKVYNFEENMPEDIINKIKNYYSSGKLRDSEDILGKED